MLESSKILFEYDIGKVIRRENIISVIAHLKLTQPRYPPIILIFFPWPEICSKAVWPAHLKAVVNTVGGLLASRRVFSWLPLFFFCSYSTNSD